jgi:hypothetical protein
MVGENGTQYVERIYHATIGQGVVNGSALALGDHQVAFP